MKLLRRQLADCPSQVHSANSRPGDGRNSRPGDGRARRWWERLRSLPRLPRPNRKWLPPSRAGLVFTAALGVVTVGAMVWSVSRSALFDVDHVEVSGAFLVPPAEAAEAAGPLRSSPLAEVDTARTEERIEALPFVRTARVERVFPNRVRIHLTERRPVALAARAEGGFALLDDTGRVLADRPERPPDLPEVLGAGEIPAPGAWLEAARPALDTYLTMPEPLRRQVSAVTVEGELVTLRVGDRDVRFGRADHIEAKVAALGALIDHLGSRPVRAIDVQVPSAPVVVPVGSPAPEAQVALEQADQSRD